MAFRVPGGLQQLSDRMTRGDSERAGSDWQPLCIHLHRTAFCLQSPHLSTHSPAGVGRCAPPAPLEKKRGPCWRRTGPLPRAVGWGGGAWAGFAGLRLYIPWENDQWAREFSFLFWGVILSLKPRACCANELALVV